jgi:hypothetical protein
MVKKHRCSNNLKQADYGWPSVLNPNCTQFVVDEILPTYMRLEMLKLSWVKIGGAVAIVQLYRDN